MITHVWIETGCTSCGACTSCAPAVFTFDDLGEAIVHGPAREDGLAGANRDERSPLRAEVATAESVAIREAAEGCPVDIIRLRETA